MKVMICIITYQRPQSLRRLLEGIQRLTFDKVELPTLGVLLVDNDAYGSAYKVYKDISRRIRFPLRYCVEPRRGRAYALNRAISCVEDDVQFIAFIDDDEVPTSTWLDELLNVQMLYDADVVTGPVLPRFDVDVPSWILKGGFFERRRYPTGHPMSYMQGGNALVRFTLFKELGQGFNEPMALSGLEDLHFALRAHRAGYKIVFANEAIVHEWVLPTRVNIRWILQRAYSGGNNVALCETDLDPSMRRHILLLAKAGRSVLWGLRIIRHSLTLGKPALVESLRHILHGGGILMGVVGYHYEQYRRPHVE